jgi:hypothetical protein
MTAFPLEETAVMFLLLNGKHELNTRKCKQFFHEARRTRKLKGEHATLFKDAADDETKFHECCKMSH